MPRRPAVAIAVGVAVLVATSLTGCIGATDRYAYLRDQLAADPSVLFVEGSDSSMPDVTNVSSINANLDPDVTTADIQRVAEIVRAELEPLSDQGPDPRVRFEIGAPTDDLDVRYPTLELSEFTIDEQTLAAEIAYWRDLDAATEGGAPGLSISFPFSRVSDYERGIGIWIERDLPTTARIDAFRQVAEVVDPTDAPTQWAVSFRPESFVMTNQNRQTMVARLGLPPTQILDLWDRMLEPLPGGGQPRLEAEWSAPHDGDTRYGTRLILRVGFPDDPGAWDRLVETAGTALAVSDDVVVVGGSGEFGVYVSTQCDDGQVKERARDRDRSAELIAALGGDDGLGICDD
ncbi:MAG: hypothetical protein ABI566_04880 [Pseudolysinimonas sp.]